MVGSLAATQLELVKGLVGSLSNLPGLLAIALGGSHARGRARLDSDIDLGLYYEAGRPLDVDRLRELVAPINDTPEPVVSGIGGWGHWVDGGAWLSLGGQRVDLLYRSFDLIEHTLAEAQAGRFVIDFEQQPPFGFFGPTVLGELTIAQPLLDSTNRLAELKSGADPFPETLVHAVVQNQLWSVDFGLRAFAPKYVASENVLAVAGSLTRFARALVLALFALNRTYFINDKTALDEVSEFALVPPKFEARIEIILSRIGSNADELVASIAEMKDLFDEVRRMSGDLYIPSWRF